MIGQSNIQLTVATLIIPIFTWTESSSFSSKSRTASWADVFRERAPFCSPLHTRPSLWYWTMGIVKKSCRPVTVQKADASINLCPSGECTKSRCIIQSAPIRWLQTADASICAHQVTVQKADAPIKLCPSGDYKQLMHQSICAHQVTVQKADASFNLCPSGDYKQQMHQSVPIRWLYKKQMHQSSCAHQVTVQKADASFSLCPSGICTNNRCIFHSVPIRYLYKQQMHHSVCAHQVFVQTADASFSLCPSGICTNSRCIIQSVSIRHLYKQQMHHSVCAHQGTTICHAVLTVTQSWMPVAAYW